MKDRKLTIIFKNDHEEEWVKYNPVLKDGEVVVSKCQGSLRYKVGDGIHPYVDLPFCSLESALGKGCLYTCNPSCFDKVKIVLFNKG